MYELKQAFKKGFQKEAQGAAVKKYAPYVGLAGGGALAGFGTKEIVDHAEELDEAIDKARDLLENGDSDGNYEIPDEAETGRKIKRLTTEEEINESDPEPLKDLDPYDPFFYKGDDDTDYIIGAEDIPEVAAQHEVGHAHEGHEVPGFLTTLKARFHRPTWEEEVMEREREAWEHVPDSEEKEEFMDAALKTYDKNFHTTRGSAALLGGTALGLGSGAALARRLR